MEERILYFDIVNGISGDMTIATLLDLGISKEVFLEEINKLNLGDEFNINIQEERRWNSRNKGRSYYKGSKCP